MIQPKTYSENLMYSTTKIKTSSGVGTGFFFHFTTDNNLPIPIIITNKHVVNYKNRETVTFFLHVKNTNGVSSSNIEVTADVEWYFHPNYDLCFTFFNPTLEKIKLERSVEIFYTYINETLIWNNAALEELSAIEDVVMIGYPIGLSDEKIIIRLLEAALQHHILQLILIANALELLIWRVFLAHQGLQYLF